MILGIYDENKRPKGVRIPEGKENAVDALLTRDKAITVAGKRYQDEDIIGLFTEEEWRAIEASKLLKPEPKTMDDLRKELEDQEWFRRAKKK